MYYTNEQERKVTKLSRKLHELIVERIFELKKDSSATPREGIEYVPASKEIKSKFGDFITEVPAQAFRLVPHFIISVASADGELSETEKNYFYARIREYQPDDADNVIAWLESNVEELKSCEHEKLVEMFDESEKFFHAVGGDMNFHHYFIFYALKVAAADGLDHEGHESNAAQKMAQHWGISDEEFNFIKETALLASKIEVASDDNPQKGISTLLSQAEKIEDLHKTSSKQFGLNL